MSETSNKGAEFLAERFPKLSTSPEVNRAAQITAKRTGIHVPRTPEARIENYLDRFRKIISLTDPVAKDRGITGLKSILTDRFVIKEEDLPEFGSKEHFTNIKMDQKGSLEEWIDYLASDKTSYLSDQLKYWAFAGILKLERYKKGQNGEPGRFPLRPSGRQRAAKMFPEVNEQALRFIATAYDATIKGQEITFPEERYDITTEAKKDFIAAFRAKDFRTVYGWGQEYFPPITEKDLQTTDGQWITYQQGSDPKLLINSLQAKGSGWCLAGKGSAQSYLDESNLTIYYTKDSEGNYTLPRVCIVYNNDYVKEVSGRAWEEHIDPYIERTDIISSKLQTLPGSDRFLETDADRKLLATIDHKITENKNLTVDELRFLYELDRPIKYDGIKKDPRIAKFLEKRDQEQDMSFIFSLAPSQIAHTQAEISYGTKAYLGQLEPGIFDKLRDAKVEHIYTSFPERKITLQSIEIGGRTKEELRLELMNNEVIVDPDAEEMMSAPEFMVLPTAQKIDLVRLTTRELGLEEAITIATVSSRAQELGLDLCPAEVGLLYRLHYINQREDNVLYLGMQPIDLRRIPHIFTLDAEYNNLFLSARPIQEWMPSSEVIFQIPPQSNKSRPPT